MDLFFLQIDTTSITHTAPKTQNLWEVLVSGGVIMIPLAILFLAAVYFFFERLIAINKAINNERCLIIAAMYRYPE